MKMLCYHNMFDSTASPAAPDEPLDALRGPMMLDEGQNVMEKNVS